MRVCVEFSLVQICLSVSALYSLSFLLESLHKLLALTWFSSLENGLMQDRQYGIISLSLDLFDLKSEIWPESRSLIAYSKSCSAYAKTGHLSGCDRALYEWFKWHRQLKLSLSPMQSDVTTFHLAWKVTNEAKGLQDQWVQLFGNTAVKNFGPIQISFQKSTQPRSQQLSRRRNLLALHGVLNRDSVSVLVLGWVTLCIVKLVNRVMQPSVLPQSNCRRLYQFTHQKSCPLSRTAGLQRSANKRVANYRHQWRSRKRLCMSIRNDWEVQEESSILPTNSKPRYLFSPHLWSTTTVRIVCSPPHFYLTAQLSLHHKLMVIIKA